MAENLPIEAALPELRAALRDSNSAVLIAPPGAGKSTRAPLALLDEHWMRGDKLLLLAPRRIAARACAARMAASLGEAVGERVGYRVRLETKVSRRTRIEVVTEGVFTRMILGDPELRGIAAVLFDEFHERSLEADLGLALALDAQRGLREDLRLLVMSATLDGGRVAALLGDAPLISSEGRTFPVQMRYLGRDARTRIEDQAASAACAALSRESGDILCFLPGAREIGRTARLLAEKIRDPSVCVAPLYGALSPAEQDVALAPAPAGMRKITLASAIAETSLTIPGVRIVIDSGFSRRPVYDAAIGLSRLETVRASQAAIAQRAGRAGRTAAGVCWRLWDEGETRALPAFDRPEIFEADLSGLVLDLARWGAAPEALAWIDPPPKPAFVGARAAMARIGALDADGRLTAHGERVAALPLPPALAHMVLRAAENGQAGLAAQLALLFTEQGLGGRDVDARTRLTQWRAERSPRAEAARRLALSIARAAGGGEGKTYTDEGVGEVLALAFPDRLARARPGKRGEYLMANGRAAALDSADPLSREEFLLVADASGSATGGARMMLAAALSKDSVERVFAGAIEAEESVRFDGDLKGVRARRVRRVGKVVLGEGPLENPEPEAVAAALAQGVAQLGLEVLPWERAGRQLRARVALLRRLEPVAWPDWSDATLLAEAEEWLAPLLRGKTRIDAIGEQELATALRSRLGPLARRLDEQAPTHLTTPAGGSHLIDYAAENGPAADVRLQELFGVRAHPAVADGRAPLLLRLLSPAGRPVQVTRDLPGFWSGSYAAVQREMRGRYPKHPWPDDPLTAPPTRRAKPRA